MNMLNKKHKPSKTLDSFNQISMTTSKKPLWISDVKATFSSFLPNTFIQTDFEEIKDIMTQDRSAEVIDQDEFPYFNTIKKIMYAFGDTISPLNETVVYLHCFIKDFIKAFTTWINECDYKKIIEHFFSYEYEKLHNYKKLKFKNNLIITGETNNNDNDDDEDNNNNNNNNNTSALQQIKEEEDCSATKKVKGKVKDKDKDKYEESGNKALLGDKEDDYITLDDGIINNAIDSVNKDNRESNAHVDNTSTSLEKDNLYKENTLFQSQRTEMMDTKQYYEYNWCRQHNFLSKGKKQFQSYLQVLIQNPFPVEWKDFNNIEFLAYILKEEIRKIITDAIKAKDPNKKLFVLTQPLTVNDVSKYCKNELDNINSFLTDYYSDIYLIKEFKKKNGNEKNFNKNIKLKKCDDDSLILVVKKFAFIKNIKDSEFLKNAKKISEWQVINGWLMWKDKLTKIKNEKVKYKQMNGTYETGGNEVFTVRDQLVFCGIDNYYEYFWIKEFLCDVNVSTIKPLEIQVLITKLTKINKKRITNKFDMWVNKEESEKDKLKNEYEELMKKEKMES